MPESSPKADSRRDDSRLSSADADTYALEATDPRREISRLKRQISYFCGVITRTESRERIQNAYAVIRERERQLQAKLSASAEREGSYE